MSSSGLISHLKIFQALWVCYLLDESEIELVLTIGRFAKYRLPVVRNILQNKYLHHFFYFLTIVPAPLWL